MTPSLKFPMRVRHRSLANTITAMQAEKGLSASDLKASEVKHILETCFGSGQKARHVRDIIQGQSAGVDESMVTCVMQGVRELAMKSGHYVEFIYERATQVAMCFSLGWSRGRI